MKQSGSLPIVSETILVVDDADAHRELVVTLLQSANYVVLQASSGAMAIDVAGGYDGEIHLLLSDVQMPGMSGPDLGATLKLSRPDLRVMLMSAFAGGNLLVLNYGWAFIQKPFVRTKLLKMINGVLHSPNKSQGSYQYESREEPKSE